MSPTWRDFLGLDDRTLFEQCEFDRFRASGPGGQKRNRTDSAVRLRHRPTGLQAEANESRSQHENRARALRRLRRTIALTLRVPDSPEPPPPGVSTALRALLDQPPRRISESELPAVAALFDALESHAWRVADAARALDSNSAAVVRALAVDDAVWRAAAMRRQALGLSPLRQGS